MSTSGSRTLAAQPRPKASAPASLPLPGVGCSAWFGWVYDFTATQPQGMAMSYWIVHLLTSSVVFREAPREVLYLAASRLLWSSSRSSIH
jgi:hypothetical protein